MLFWWGKEQGREEEEGKVAAQGGREEAARVLGWGRGGFKEGRRAGEVRGRHGSGVHAPCLLLSSVRGRRNRRVGLNIRIRPNKD